MKHYRDPVQIIAAYLELPVATKGQRMQNANMPYCCGGKYHELLIKQGCLEPVDATATYKTTKKGWLMVRMIEAMLELLGWERQAT